jgi:hypothetical protein
MKLLLAKIKTAHALGLGNIAHVVFYRLKTKMGLDFERSLRANMSSGLFFRKIDRHASTLTRSLGSGSRLQNNGADEGSMLFYFGWWKRLGSTEPPDWHLNPMNGVHTPADKPWWEFADFNAHVGDIKLIWEASRFTWIFPLISRYLIGDEQALEQLNIWLADWCEKNPAYLGVNWKCGQEVSIRVLHLAMGAMLLEQDIVPTPVLTDLITLHLQRIALTLRYAMSQDNNHGTSEAAALFID